jgi:hypothetical protein
MALDEAANQVQLSGTEAMAASKPERLEPELAGLVLPLHMNVRGLAPESRGAQNSPDLPKPAPGRTRATFGFFRAKSII